MAGCCARSIESRPMLTQADLDSLARLVLLGAFALSAVFGAVVAVQVAVIIGLVRSKLLTSRSAVSQRVSDAV